jgi:hypothetical protein
VKNPLTPLEQNVITLVWRTGRMPSEIMAEDERWIDLLLLDAEARTAAVKR